MASIIYREYFEHVVAGDAAVQGANHGVRDSRDGSVVWFDTEHGRRDNFYIVPDTDLRAKSPENLAEMYAAFKSDPEPVPEPPPIDPGDSNA